MEHPPGELACDEDRDEGHPQREARVQVHPREHEQRQRPEDARPRRLAAIAEQDETEGRREEVRDDLRPHAPGRGDEDDEDPGQRERQGLACASRASEAHEEPRSQGLHHGGDRDEGAITERLLQGEGGDVEQPLVRDPRSPARGEREDVRRVEAGRERVLAVL